MTLEPDPPADSQPQPPSTSIQKRTTGLVKTPQTEEELLTVLRLSRRDPSATFKSTFQRDLLKSVLAGNHTLAVIPTGGGKSVAFEVPPFFQQQVTVAAFPYKVILSQATINAERALLAAQSWTSKTVREIEDQRLIIMPFESIATKKVTE